MTEMRRVAITGLGAITALGHDLQSTWSSLLEGKPGISSISNMSTDLLQVKIGGEIKNFTISPDLLSEREAPRFDVFIHYSLHAGHEAFKDSGLLEDNPYDPERVGCIQGVGIGGFTHMENAVKTAFGDKGVRRMSPFMIPSIIPNMGAGFLTIKLGLKGINYSIASACASSAHALSAAADEIRLGRHDVILSGGAEGVLCTTALGGFQVMKALSKRNDEPAKASRPFDKDRDGFVMGEGAGMLVLEDLEKAKARGAKIYAELVGYGATSDAEHITAPQSEGLGASACMNKAIRSAGISPEAIGYVNAHGTSTPLGDIAETKALKKTFGDHAYNLKISSTKSMTGHLLGAAGGLESVVCVKTLNESIAPPTINLDNQDPECDLDYTANKAFKGSFEYALNNSFGFGGTNSTVIFKAHH